MRLFVVHDDAGTIYQAVRCPSDAPAPALQTAPGLQFSEVDPPEGFREDADLREFVNNHRAENMARPRGSVVRLTTPEDQ
ncbi:hypothetical protein EV644_10362 [Kribbella orskensis]|uniref:Uncharacterized protein n=1 Tax=Kribbella orskensis TaxID=2512216 RepID=A0ABY2BPI4_9ACTN|nr:hypothetical protein EV642_106358 [Kribbella sp. VKM Ac-2500]TCO27365.1 hypothetical protein EV644_10362 [Kribbella orskensis]